MKLEELRGMFRKGKSPPELTLEPMTTETGAVIYPYAARSKNDYNAIGEGTPYAARSKNDYNAIGEGTPYYEACKIVGFEKGEGLDAVKVWCEEEFSNNTPVSKGLVIDVISEIVYDTKDSIRHLLLLALDGAGTTGTGYSIIDVYVDAKSRKLTCYKVSDHLNDFSVEKAFATVRASIEADGYDIIRTQSWSR